MAYKVPFVNYPAHYRSMEAEIDAAIKEVLSQGDLILRRHVREFEEKMAALLGVEYCVGVHCCTDALHLSLRAAGIGPSDEVITVAHTFVATISAIVHSGATPVLVDVAEDFNMDPECLERAVTSRTRAVIPVDFNGRVCNMEKIMAVTERHGLTIIEDSAQALGGTFDGKKAGSFGLSGCFSFYPAKLLGAAGDAGLVSTNDLEFAETIRLLRDHGRKEKDELVFYGFNSRLDNLQAAILNVKLNYVPRWIARRREIAERYFAGLADVPGVLLPPRTGGRYFDVYQNFVLRVEDRNRLADHLREKGVEVIVSNPIPVHFQKGLNLSHFKLPNTERFANEVISIPNIPELTDDQIDYVIETVRNFYSTKAAGR